MGVSTLLAPSSSAFAAKGDQAQVQIGSLSVSETRRRRVRGGRPDGASVHVAWAPGARDPGREDTDALAGFERATFPQGQRTKTIIDAPPDPWMAELKLPDLPVRWNKKTVEYLRYFRDDPKGKAMIRGWMRRAGRYSEAMASTLERAEVPTSLVMVAMAESGFNPTVRSRVGAAGAWQFMAGTGQVYGLGQSFWVDARFDVEKSTLAAALYLKDLRVRFGSWELALAAYNAGYGLVMTTIERHNTNNYWSLCEIESGLPYATTNYVPKIVAAALVRANPKAFGVHPSQIKVLPAADWVEVRVQRSTRLSTLAEVLDVDADFLFELNAHLIRERTPPSDVPYSVRIPRDKAQAFASAQSKLETAWSQESTHAVKTGESLASIARRYKTSTRELRKLNGIRDSAEVRGGITLIVPRPGAKHAEADTRSEPPPRPLAAVPDIAVPPGHRLVFFQTTRASTPRELERSFDVPWPDVVRWNDLDPHARVQAAQVLQIVVPSSFDPASEAVIAHEMHEVEYVVRGSRAHLEAALLRRGKRRRGYKTKSGDTLAKIGRRFELSVGDLARINHFSRGHDPKPGNTLVVYVDKGKVGGTVKAPSPRGFTDAKPPPPAQRAPSTAGTSRVPDKAAPKPSPQASTKAPAKAPPARKLTTTKPAAPTRVPSTAATARTPGARDPQLP
ncbi:MAG: LysM peptidoglycan-binding domain-containing protein [Nannocystales bacterium]